MRIHSLAILLMPVIFTSLSHAAGIQVGRTRIIYDAGKKEISLPLINKETTLPWLIQSWTDTGDGKTRGPFIVTPPLFRLEPQKEQSLRIAWNGTALPENKESLFYMNVRTIPATANEDDDKNVLRLIYKTRIKLFWRPKDLKGTPEETCKNLRFSLNGKQLTVTNDGPFHITFDSLQLGTTKLDKADMVSPLSSVQVPVTGTASGSNVSWRCITDYGNASEKYTAPLTQG
ncbi:molecular chaperone [Lelliottia sp. CFBP8978]|uniref:fimbrial biogenesis chaperone n=1 Tax=Lelliottia sp. CFBP8978 TaxID=3096522 RepID=UPI002A6B6F3E|nr:molecular chaperone [Lelliottia sp. CFBP8978]MDY1039077.1 molecular chaperone [Lelliottia sp. CFBP8978]